MNEYAVLVLEEKIRKVKDVDLGNAGTCLGRCVRVRVEVDVTKPLEWGFDLHLDEEETVYALVRYERLSAYCHDCGIIGHTKTLPKTEIEILIPKKTAKYADWLKVPFIPRGRGPNSHPVNHQIQIRLPMIRFPNPHPIQILPNQHHTQNPSLLTQIMEGKGLWNPIKPLSATPNHRKIHLPSRDVKNIKKPENPRNPIENSGKIFDQISRY